MAPDLVNADFSQRVIIATDTLPWTASPQPGVERRLLDRIGGEVARATSLVRYAPASAFPAHDHALGEEFLVLDGVFSDEHGDYPAGTYVRNPPHSRHTPRTGPGCTILVKLRQMRGGETHRVVVDTAQAAWQQGAVAGLSVLRLYAAADGETVALERLAPGARLPACEIANGEEIYLIEGDLADERGSYAAGTWMRNPPGFRHELMSTAGAVYWVKRGHLPPKT
jgi:anti-sigma factor ChrR (cupin superfamily)